jgi:hypothetical protein
MNPGLEKLHDIKELDFISSWPLSPAWWVVIVLGALVLVSLVAFVVYTIAFNRSWKKDTLQKLLNLEKNLSDDTAREIAITLSEYLRRIALRRFSRKECAGLVGEDWLKWLKERDLRDFDWEKKGEILIKVPYAPSNLTLSVNEVKDLIQAVRDWVR